MRQIRRAQARGFADHGWLKSQHTFSFADYHDPAFMGFANLRVINEDRVAPGGGFATHPHRDMEIISYVLSGELVHQDSMGNGSTIRPGDVQRMTAGTGVRHSERNGGAAPVHFLQIWIMPDVVGLPPSYAQQTFTDAQKQGRLCLLASPDASSGSLRLHADARLYAARLSGDDVVTHEVARDRSAWIHVASGQIVIDGERLGAGDAIAITDTTAVRLSSGEAAEVLVFDLPRA